MTDTRFSGHWIVARQGMGKTTLLKQMFAKDAQTDCSIVILDSKGELSGPIRKLALGDRLVVIDPDDRIGINPFAATKSEHVISHLGYMLGGLLETNITPKQRTFFDTLVECLFAFPNPSIPLLWDILSNSPKAYKNQISTYSEDIQSFFFREWETYTDTAKEMQWRLRGLKSKKSLWDMLSAQQNRFDIGQAMDEGKIIVIDNTQAKCTAEGCGFIGRLFLAQIWSAGTQRALRPPHLKKPVYVYIDEAHLIIKRDQKVAAIIDELRSQKIGLILAHQRLRGQIDDINVQAALENCAIKTVNVDAEAHYFSKLLHIPEDRMNQLPRFHFAQHHLDYGPQIVEIPQTFSLPFRNMTFHEEEALRRSMIQLYGITGPSPAPIKRDSPKPSQPNDSDAASEW
jgi:type IV secretory pathway VirB4 component